MEVIFEVVIPIIERRLLSGNWSGSRQMGFLLYILCSILGISQTPQEQLDLTKDSVKTPVWCS